MSIELTLTSSTASDRCWDCSHRSVYCGREDDANRTCRSIHNERKRYPRECNVTAGAYSNAHDTQIFAERAGADHLSADHRKEHYGFKDTHRRSEQTIA